MNISRTKIRSRMKLLVFVLMCGFLLLFPARSLQAKVHAVRTAADWKNIGKYKGGSFKLTKNIRLSRKYYLTISKNRKYVIDLNGHKIVDKGTGSKASPLVINNGKVLLKNSKKKGGVLYSKEWMAVQVNKKGTLYMTSGSVINDTVEFRTGLASAIYLTGKAKCYIQGKAYIRSINNGVSLMGKSRLYTKGTPTILAGYLNTSLNFTHYGSGVLILEKGCKVSLKGGRIGTMATPDTVIMGITYTGSGHYPVLDRQGKSLAIPKGYQCIDFGGNVLSVQGSNVDSLFRRIMGSTGSLRFPGEKKITTQYKDSSGYYSVIFKKK